MSRDLGIDPSPSSEGPFYSRLQPLAEDLEKAIFDQAIQVSQLKPEDYRVIEKRTITPINNKQSYVWRLCRAIITLVRRVLGPDPVRVKLNLLDYPTSVADANSINVLGTRGGMLGHGAVSMGIEHVLKDSPLRDQIYIMPDNNVRATSSSVYEMAASILNAGTNKRYLSLPLVLKESSEDLRGEQHIVEILIDKGEDPNNDPSKWKVMYYNSKGEGIESNKAQFYLKDGKIASVAQLVEELEKQSNAEERSWVIQESTSLHQQDCHSCGVFVIRFHDLFFKQGIPFKDIANEIMTTKKIEDYRDDLTAKIHDAFTGKKQEEVRDIQKTVEEDWLL